VLSNWRCSIGKGLESILYDMLILEASLSLVHSLFWQLCMFCFILLLVIFNRSLFCRLIRYEMYDARCEELYIILLFMGGDRRIISLYHVQWRVNIKRRSQNMKSWQFSLQLNINVLLVRVTYSRRFLPLPTLVWLLTSDYTLRYIVRPQLIDVLFDKTFFGVYLAYLHTYSCWL